jgi:quercetin dioxygenase-like cupin family protein
MTVTDDPAFFLLDEIEWPAEGGAGNAPTALVEEAKRRGARRKFLATGHGGFHSQYSTMPPGYVVPMHSHDHNEIIVVLAGGCTMLGGGPTLKAHDSMVMISGHEYGFECGPEGMEFLTIRTAQASTSLA